jgi:hypothetical protein
MNKLMHESLVFQIWRIDLYVCNADLNIYSAEKAGCGGSERQLVTTA